MIGVFKKRSCELFVEIEEYQLRGFYFGVVGYMDVIGVGDWSVIIRSMFWYDDEMVDLEFGEIILWEVWYIGVGGVVIIFSIVDGEWEEMFMKFEGLLGVFRDMVQGF